MQLTDITENSTLRDAIGQLLQQLRAQPDSADLRAQLVQLLALEGDWHGALAQLKAWRALAASAAPTVDLLAGSIAGELARERVFRLEAAPTLLTRQSGWTGDMVRTLHAPEERETLLAHLPANGGELVRRAAPHAPERFSWLADGDERLGPVCELIVDGVYCWAALHDIQQIRFQPPASAFDLVWRQCHLRLHDGSDHLGQMPVRYPRHEEDSDAHRLARQTSWRPLPQGYIGHGQRVWLDGEREWALLDIDTIRFGEPA